MGLKIKCKRQEGNNIKLALIIISGLIISEIIICYEMFIILNGIQNDQFMFIPALAFMSSITLYIISITILLIIIFKKH